MSLLYENFLRKTHSNNIQEWFLELKDLLAELEDEPDPGAEDIQLAYHMTQFIESFELIESNLLVRRKTKNKGIDNLYKERSSGSSVLFKE